MKKTTIWAISIIMGLSLTGLLVLQLTYIEEMVRMRKEQFDSSVNKGLYQASRNLELNETLRYLERDINEKERQDVGTPQFNTSFKMKTLAHNPAKMPKAMLLTNDKHTLSEAQRSMREIVKNRYVYQKALLDEVVYSMLYTASDKPLKERINFKLLDQDIKTELANNGINIDYHFTVATQDGREVYRCSDYDAEGEEYAYEQVLFRNDPRSSMGVVKIHFPKMKSYIFSGIMFLIPSLVFTFVLLVTFIFTIVVIFRQKKLSEMKNDFINNMTHELKTPISSISLASQMLNDDSVKKSETMTKHLASVIGDETKRLRFLVEKVLQMSMFEQQKAIFKKKELDVNDLLDTVSQTFSLRVEHTGGHVDLSLNATHPTAYVDEMHFSNMLFNLMDNAIKYRSEDRELILKVSSWNDDKHLYLSVADNGQGIKKENQKKIFEKFYRVHTGNQHNVKGFGLGLAYVKKVVDVHKGTIKVESEYGKGTTFTIELPLIKNED